MKKLKKLTMTLVALFAMTTGAWAQEQSETIDTKAIIVEGTHFTISNNDDGADDWGMYATKGITVTPKNGETITKVVISCTDDYEEVSDDNTSVSSGTKEITNDGETITVTDVNASTFTFTCSHSSPQFGQFVVYYTAAPAGATETTVTFTASDLVDGSSITKDGVTLTSYGQYGINMNGVNGPGEFTNSLGGNFTKIVVEADGLPSGDGWKTGTWTGSASSVSFTGDIEYYGEVSIVCTLETPPAGPEVTWDAATKQATFAMPAYDVELQVEYYPGLLTFGGDAIEGGTVEVVGLTGDALPAGFEKDAEGNIYVAQGTTFTVKATPEEGYHFVCWSDDETNTNPEREITMPADGSDLSLTATFAENEYDITFSEGTNPDPENPEWTAAPNPAKTKETVTVTYSGTKKVIGVKAEKKAAVPTLKDALADGATVVITYTWDGSCVTTFTYTNNGGNYTGNATGDDAEYFSNGMSKDGTTLKFTVSNKDLSDANVSIEFDTDTNEYVLSKGSVFTSFTISVNGTDLTSQLAEVK